MLPVIITNKMIRHNKNNAPQFGIHCVTVRRSVFGFLIYLVFSCVSGVEGIVDYCDELTFESNSSWLQFTKEINTRDFAISAKFKSLHCCAKGYRSIEW